MKIKDIIDLNKQKDKRILAIYLVWLSINIILLAVGQSLATGGSAEGFFPFYNATKDYFYPDGRLSIFLAYDFSEFMVYSLIPVICYTAYKLLVPSSNEIEALSNRYKRKNKSEVGFRNKSLVSYTRPEGWLLILILALAFFNPLMSTYYINTSYQQLSGFFDQYSGVKHLFYIDTTFSLILMVLSINAGNALWLIKYEAVKKTKQYLLFFLGYSGVSIFLPFIFEIPFETNDILIQEGIKTAGSSLLYFIIWYSYLNMSYRVNATYRT